MVVALFVVSLVMVVVMALGYARGAAGITVAAIVLAVGTSCVAHPITAINFLVLIVAAIGCAAAKTGPSRFALTAIVSTLAIYVGAALLHLPKYREHLALCAENPIVDVDARLAYESRGVGSDAESASDREARWNAPSLQQVEERVASDRTVVNTRSIRAHERSVALRSLLRTHHGFVADFIDAEGFGAIRMFRLPAERKWIDLEDPPPVELPPLREPQPATSDDSAEQNAPLANRPAVDIDGALVARPEPAPATVPDTTVLTRTHEAGLFDFVNPKGFGHVESRKEVVGFRSHAFREAPRVKARDENAGAWQIVQLELVSLLKHDPAAAYVSKHLPRMDELRDAPTRPLDGFERDALERLRSGEDLVVDSTPDEIRMLGPLRAYRECLECHRAKANALLGAFTYRLRPVGATRRPTAMPEL